MVCLKMKPRAVKHPTIKEKKPRMDPIKRMKKDLKMKKEKVNGQIYLQFVQKIPQSFMRMTYLYVNGFPKNITQKLQSNEQHIQDHSYTKFSCEEETLFRKYMIAFKNSTQTSQNTSVTPECVFDETDLGSYCEIDNYFQNNSSQNISNCLQTGRKKSS